MTNQIPDTTIKKPKPRTTMVYCPPCMRHWEAPAREDYWNARTELCPKHQKMADEDYKAYLDAFGDAQGQY